MPKGNDAQYQAAFASRSASRLWHLGRETYALVLKFDEIFRTRTHDCISPDYLSKAIPERIKTPARLWRVGGGVDQYL